MHMARIMASMAIFAGAAAAQTSTIKVNNEDRTFIVHAPSGLVKPPLVIALHGLTENMQLHKSRMKFEPIADREKFVVAFPQGIGNSWDITGMKDVDFIAALIDTLAKRHDIDRARVYATGFSMGGMISYYLANKIADRIAAIAPISGYLMRGDPAASSRPMPILHIHGAADDFVKFSNLPPILKGWRDRNKCPAASVVTKPYPASRPGSKVTREHWAPCEKSEVLFYSIAGLGHAFYVGPDFNGSEEIWAFLKKYSLEGPVATGPEAFGSAKPRPVSVRYISGIIHLQGGQGLHRVRISDIRGQAHYRWTAGGVPEGSLAIPVGRFPTGVYLVEVQGHSGREAVRVALP